MMMYYRAILTLKVWSPYRWFFNLYFDMVYLRNLVSLLIRERSRNCEALDCMYTLYTKKFVDTVPWPTRREKCY